MSKVAAIAWLVAKSGRRDELIEVLKRVWHQVESETGTEIYAMNLADVDSVFYYLIFSDEDAYAAHITGPAMQEAMREIDDLVALAPEWIRATPIWAKVAQV